MKALKFIGILTAGLLLRMGMAFLSHGDPIGTALPYRDFVTACKGPVILAMLTVIYGLLLMVYLLFHKRWPGKPAVKGIIFGALFGALWAVGMIEAALVLKTSLLHEILFGLSEIPPILLMGLLAGLAFSRREDDKTETGLTSLSAGLPSSVIVALALVVGRYFSYTVLQVDSAFAALPAATFIWTLAFALMTGLIYLFLGRNLPGSPVVRSLLFGFVVFGIDWMLYNLVVPFLFRISLSETLHSYFVRVLADCLYVTLGILVSSRTTETRQTKTGGDIRPGR
jgi:hypothetical protein